MDEIHCYAVTDELRRSIAVMIPELKAKIIMRALIEQHLKFLVSEERWNANSNHTKQTKARL